ncbi:hypothetical protein L210DRAFT_3756331 [Boletus edulis BED1]|uniref:BZIP domain-containing protein n=1 Tax=Boletus edulis BED1 TaxID=1328754 RepID=A0AAD4C776_BOLED|nr:hypothetical protein L210DRAFT_3756331 [Boletus edulis BED1]
MPDDTTRSLSGEADFDSDNEFQSQGEQDTRSVGPGKPGRKKNPNSQAARRDQNRIAQREFRLRKQQRIRDLEARVELLSGSQDEAFTDMRAILKDLMVENITLRNLLKSVSGFIAEGSGGMIQKLGFEMHEWTAYLDKAETDTAWESFQARKNAKKTSHSSNAMSSMLGAQPSTSKRPLEDDAPSSNHLKKSKTLSGDNSMERPDSYHLLMPMSSTVPPPPPPASSMYPSTARSPQDSLFSEVLRNGHASSPVFMGPTPSGTPAHYASPSTSSTYSSYMPPMGIGVDQGMNSLPYPPNKNGAVASQQRILPTTQNDEPEDDEAALLELRDPKKIEAFKLIKYHLENYMRNSAYCLPSSLRPTLVQRTINHESVIDRIVHPGLRDRIILLRGQFSLADCLFDYKKAIKLHGDDVLAHSNWELPEWWLRKYSYLIENTTLSICNRWRRERGESELTMSDIGAQGDSPTS